MTAAARLASLDFPEHGFAYWQTVGIPDARRSGPGIGWKEQRRGPKHAAVWVRVNGAWRKGRIIEWVREVDRPSWDAVIVPDEPRRNEPLAGRYVYDRQAIRPRYNDSPPGEGPNPPARVAPRGG